MREFVDLELDQRELEAVMDALIWKYDYLQEQISILGDVFDQMQDCSFYAHEIIDVIDTYQTIALQINE